MKRSPLLVIFITVFIDLVGFGIVIPVLPFYAEGTKVGATASQVGLLFASYSIMQCGFAPVLGRLSDKYGRRPVLLASLLGTALGFLILGFATTLWMLFLGRIIDGISGGNISTAQAYISDVTTPENRAKGMGMIGAAFGIGFTIGPALGGVLGHFDMSLPAFAAATFSGIAALQTFLRLPESRVHKESEAEAWLHPSRFVPIIRNSPLLQMLLIFFISMAAFVMMESTFAIFLNDLLKFDELHVGLLFALAGVTIATVQGGLVGRLTKKFGEWPLVIAGPLLVTAAMLMLVELHWRPAIALLIFAVICNASGRSLQTPTLSALISHT